MNMQQRVEEFHKVFGHPINRPEEINSIFFVNLRSRLHSEEEDELRGELWQSNQEQKIRPNLLKEIGDLLYVIMGTCVSLGIDAEECVRLVHESNMSKLGEDGNPIFREDGKVLKGPNYKPPDMSVLLFPENAYYNEAD